MCEVKALVIDVKQEPLPVTMDPVEALVDGYAHASNVPHAHVATRSPRKGLEIYAEGGGKGEGGGGMNVEEKEGGGRAGRAAWGITGRREK